MDRVGSQSKQNYRRLYRLESESGAGVGGWSRKVVGNRSPSGKKLRGGRGGGGGETRALEVRAPKTKTTSTRAVTWGTKTGTKAQRHRSTKAGMEARARGRGQGRARRGQGRTENGASGKDKSVHQRCVCKKNTRAGIGTGTQRRAQKAQKHQSRGGSTGTGPRTGRGTQGTG